MNINGLLSRTHDFVGASGVRFTRTPPHRRGRPKGTKLPCGATEYDTEIGKFVVPPGTHQDIIAMHIARGLVFENEVLESCRPYMPKGGVVLDVGANLGQMAVQFARLVGPNGRVLAFEAQPYLAPFLQTNLSANAPGVAEMVFGAVGEDNAGFVYFPKPDLKEFGSFGSYPIPRDVSGDHSDRVPKVCLDEYSELPRVNLVKVDIQGHDLFALRGGKRMIEKHRPALIFEFEEQFQKENGTCFQDYLDFLVEMDYRIVSVVNGINYLATHASANFV